MYTDSFEIHSAQVDLSTTGDKLRWGPTADGFVVTGYGITLSANASAGVVALAHRPTYGSDTGRTTHTTFTVPSGSTAGRVLYKKLTSKLTLTPGQELVVAVNTGVTGNTAAKITVFGYYDHEAPHNAANVTVV